MPKLIKIADQEKDKGGRPKFEMTEKRRHLCLSLAAILCTNEEIAQILGICKDTFYVRLSEDDEFSDSFKKARYHGKASIRRAQFRRAMNGSDTMLIWLGKTELKQTETIELVNKNLDAESVDDLRDVPTDELKKYVNLNGKW